MSNHQPLPAIAGLVDDESMEMRFELSMSELTLLYNSLFDHLDNPRAEQLLNKLRPKIDENMSIRSNFSFGYYVRQEQSLETGTFRTEFQFLGSPSIYYDSENGLTIPRESSPREIKYVHDYLRSHGIKTDTLTAVSRTDRHENPELATRPAL